MAELSAARAAGKTIEKLTRAKIAERKERAFRAYLDVLNTAAWSRYQVEVQLGDFDLNLERFRLLELFREGPMTITAITRRRCCTRQSLFGLAERVAESVWLRIEPVRLPVAETEEDDPGRSYRVS